MITTSDETSQSRLEEIASGGHPPSEIHDEMNQLDAVLEVKDFNLFTVRRRRCITAI